MFKVVVTGASGFLGQHVCTYLKDKGYYVIPVSRRLLPGFIQVEDYRKIPQGDILIHLGENPHRQSVNKLGKYYLEETAQTTSFLSAFFNGNIIYASSGLVYDEHGSPPYTPYSPVKALDCYTQSKLKNEEIVLSTGGMVCRLSNIFGEGMSSQNVISHIVSQLAFPDKDFFIQDDTAVRDFLWVYEAAQAFELAIVNKTTGIFNIASGAGILIRNLILLFLREVGQIDRVINVTNPSEKNSVNILSILETKKMLGWRPSDSQESHLLQLIKDKTNET